MESIPLRVLPIHSFLGDHQSHESITLAAVHSTSGSKNVWLDEFGSVQPIGGWTKQNQTPVTAGDGPMRLAGIYPYGVYQQINGVLETLESLIGFFVGTAHIHDVRGDLIDTLYTELRISYDAGVTWGVLTPPPTIPSPDAPNGFFDSLTDAVPYFAQLGDLLVITGPSRDPLSYDGSVLNLLNTTITLTAPVAVNAAVGNLNGNYRWRVIDVLTNGERAPARIQTNMLNLVNRSATITWAASVSPLIQSYEVYRTTGDDTIFFLAATQPAGTLTTTDNLSDLDLIQHRTLQEHGDPPPFAALCCVHQQRMFYGRHFDVNGNPTFPRKWAYSDPGRPDSVYQEKSFVDCSDGDSIGDFATGGVGDYNGMAVLFNERSIWTLSGTGQYFGAVIDYRLHRADSRTGTVSGRSILRIPAGSRWSDQTAQMVTTNKVQLAYFTNRRDIRLFDGDNDTIISYPVEKTLKRITWSARHRISCVMDDSRQEATWLLPLDGSPQPNYAVTWNYRHGVWYTRPDWQFACATNVQFLTNPSILLAGEADATVGGYCYLLWNGRTRPDGQKPDAQWMSKTIYTPARLGEMEAAGENFSTQKRFRWADWLFWVSAPMNLEVAWLLPEANDDDNPIGTKTIAPGSVFLTTADGSRIVTANGSFLQVALVGTGTIRRTQFLAKDGRFDHARGIRLRIREAVSA